MMDINIIQTLQNSSLGKISNFVSNHTLHKHLKITTVLNEAKLFYKRFHNKLHFRPNHLIKNVSTSSILGSLPKAKIVSWSVKWLIDFNFRLNITIYYIFNIFLYKILKMNFFSTYIHIYNLPTTHLNFNLDRKKFKKNHLVNNVSTIKMVNFVWKLKSVLHK